MYNIKLETENIVCIKKVGTLQQIDCDYCGPLNVNMCSESHTGQLQML